MADGFSFDFSEITALTADIAKGMKVVPDRIAEHVAETAQKVQKDWQEPLRGSEHLPGGASSITWEIVGVSNAVLARSAISAEIGPILRGQGPVIGMLEFGTPTTGARGFGAEALRKNEREFEAGFSRAVEDVL